MSMFTVYPSSVTSFHSRGNRQKGRNVDNWTNFTYFVLAMFSLALALEYQHGEFQPTYGKTSSSFLGSASVSAAVATTALSTNIPRAGRPTTLSMTAGSSRTLIELTNQDNDESGEYLFEVKYLDDDDEHGLLVLRRANVDTGDKSTKSVVEGGRTIYRRAARVLKNPIVFMVLAGNVASMIGILPPGVTGFLPAVGIFLGSKSKWVAPVMGRISSLRAPVFKAMFSKLKVKLGKAISSLYKNRSKYSLLSDCLWYVDVDEKKKTKHEDSDNGARSSTYRAIA